MLRRHLCAIHGNDDSRHADTKATDNTSDIEAGDGVRIDGLQYSTDAEDQRGECQGPSSAKACSEGPDEETGKESFSSPC